MVQERPRTRHAPAYGIKATRSPTTPQPIHRSTATPTPPRTARGITGLMVRLRESSGTMDLPTLAGRKKRFFLRNGCPTMSTGGISVTPQVLVHGPRSTAYGAKFIRRVTSWFLDLVRKSATRFA